MILGAGKTDFKLLIKEILQGDAKTKDVVSVIIGDIVEDPTTRVAHQRFSSGGEFEATIKTDRKQLLKITDPKLLQQLINGVETQELQAKRALNSLGENEVSVISNFKNTISKFKQLIDDISLKIEESTNPPPYNKATAMNNRVTNEKFLVNDGGAIYEIFRDDAGKVNMVIPIHAP